MIIIGSGAGGGTLAYTPGAVRQAHPAPRARAYVPREKENWDSHAVNVEARYHIKEAVARQGRQGVPRRRALLRRRQHQVLRRRADPSAQAGLRRGTPPRRHLAGVADHLRRPRAVLHAGRASVSGARRARRRSDRAARQRALPAPAAQPRAAHPGARRRPDAARSPARSPCRSASCCDEQNPRREHAASAATPATAFPASCTPRPTRRSSASTRRCEHPNVTLLTDAYVTRLETSRVRPRGDGGPRRAQRRARRPIRRTSWSSSCGRHQLGGAAAALGQRPPSRTVWPTARTSSAATTCATSTRCSWRSRATRTRRASRRRSGLNDFYFASKEWEYPMGHISMMGNVDAQHPARRARRASCRA